MPTRLDQDIHAAEILDYLLGDIITLIFLRYVADVAAVGASDAGRDALRLLSFKVQEGDGSAVFRKHLGGRQSDTLLRRRA